MATKKIVCGSCGRSQSDSYTRFPCPNRECGSEVVRCASCRENSVKWVCRKCGATGP